MGCHLYVISMRTDAKATKTPAIPCDATPSDASLYERTNGIMLHE